MSTLERTVLSPPLTPLKHTLFSHDGVRLRDVCSTTETIPGGYSHTLPIWVCAAQRGRDFEAPDLEWGIHFSGVF